MTICLVPMGKVVSLVKATSFEIAKVISVHVILFLIGLMKTHNQHQPISSSKEQAKRTH